MEKLTLDLPAMYGDHHVVNVRRILFETPGVKDVYASSCFQVVEVTYDPAQVNAETITARLAEAGYLEPLSVPLESEQTPAQRNQQTAYFRHTAAYQQTGKAVGFAQNVSYLGRPLWPCPGMEPIKLQKDGEGE
jgi:copper chaperone CopZ